MFLKSQSFDSEKEKDGGYTNGFFLSWFLTSRRGRFYIKPCALVISSYVIRERGSGARVRVDFHCRGNFYVLLA